MLTPICARFKVSITPWVTTIKIRALANTYTVAEHTSLIWATITYIYTRLALFPTSSTV